jgi:hypothetical protein
MIMESRREGYGPAALRFGVDRALVMRSERDEP